MTLIKESIDSIDEIGGIMLDVENRALYGDLRETLDSFQGTLAEQHAEMFSGEHDSNGVPWEPLRPSTVARKGHSQILFESGDLQASLVDLGGPGHIGETNDRWMTFGTDVPYATFHQEGTSKFPARPPVGVSEENVDKLVNSIADATVENMKYTL